MNESTNNSAVKPMRFGRAMHMDLSRASDADLERAYKVLNDYDLAGKASAYTQEAIDDRLCAIDDEGDHRAGVTTVYVAPKPGLRAQHEQNLALQAAGAIGEELDDQPVQAGLRFGRNAAEEAEAESGDIDTPNEDERDLARALDPAQTDGLVPGETSSI